MGNEIYLISAYAVAWVGIACYVYINIRKLVVIERKITDLEEKTGG